MPPPPPGYATVAVGLPNGYDSRMLEMLVRSTIKNVYGLHNIVSPSSDQYKTIHWHWLPTLIAPAVLVRTRTTRYKLPKANIDNQTVCTGACNVTYNANLIKLYKCYKCIANTFFIVVLVARRLHRPDLVWDSVLTYQNVWRWFYSGYRAKYVTFHVNNAVYV